MDVGDGRRRQFVGDPESTRSQLRSVQRFDFETDDGETEIHVRIAQVYRHADDYPDAVHPALQRFQALLQTTRTERGPSYAAATFVPVEKCRVMRFSLDRGPGRSFNADSPADVLDVRSWVALEQPLFLMGYGVEDPTDGIHGDEEYLHIVEVPDPDPVIPGEAGDWYVKVSEHCGFAPLEAIVAGTRTAAEAIGLDCAGTLEPGSYADLVVDGDPVDDVSVLADWGNLSVEVKGGEVIENSLG